jgi:hypothetical protein
MLSFNDKGLLTPDKNITCSVKELKQHFVDAIPSETRLLNFEKYIHYSNELKKLLKIENFIQWVNGSFVNLQTANPKDIDLITFIDHGLAEKYKTELENFGARSANSIFGVDAYLLITYPEEHPAHAIYSSDRAYWASHFSRTRRDRYGKKNPKGYLEIIY